MSPTWTIIFQGSAFFDCVSVFLCRGASLEHELNYKKDVANKDELRQVMTDKVKLITKLDYEMNDLKQQIWHEHPEEQHETI